MDTDSIMTTPTLFITATFIVTATLIDVIMNLLMVGQMRQLITLIITNVIKDMIFVPMIGILITEWKIVTATFVQRNFIMMTPTIMDGTLIEISTGTLIN